MDLKTFFKPTKWKVIIFIALAISLYWFFTNTDTRIFPCQTQPGIPNPPPLKDSICGLGTYFGARQLFTPLGYLLIVLMLIILPYLIACGLNSLIKQK